MRTIITKNNAYQEIRKQIRKIERYLLHYSQELQGTHGVTGPQLGVLGIIANNPHATLTDLAKIVGFHITTVDGFVDRLHKQKLIAKRRKRKDKRSIEISITEKGKKILKEAPVGGFRNLHLNLQKVSPEETQRLYDALVQLVELFGASEIEVS